MNAVIAEANREFRSQLRLAEQRGHDRAKVVVPFAYIDHLLSELEALHLDGLRDVPTDFLPRFLALNRLLPAGIEPPRRWRRLIRDAIERCFELQERLLVMRDPSYVEHLEPEEEGDLYLQDSLEA